MWQELTSLSCFQPIKYDSCGLFIDAAEEVPSVPGLWSICIMKGCFILSDIFSKSIEMITAMFCSVITVKKKRERETFCPRSTVQWLKQKTRVLTQPGKILFLPLKSRLFSRYFHQLLLAYETRLRTSPSWPSCNAHSQEGGKEKWKDKLSIESGMVLAISQCFRVLRGAHDFQWRQLYHL